ncbi:hypothetical protein HPT27_03580 [Permianibacter sp. IMCC34836]|uniref:hypothetical protein n=1 Tax=Permianibacter fluminis TaxID=2738515 RepID=UPI001556AE74|nr:hypothetical protein [Permianibacter fluminis]NQD36091.1 hypothetical protein [Permianibacter fluminis]
MNRDTLFIAKQTPFSTLDTIALAIFKALELLETEERFSSNYPPDDHYFAAYGKNVVLKVFDMDDVKPEYPFCVSIDKPTYRHGEAQIPTDSSVLAAALAEKGFRVFEPNGPWYSTGWNGEGKEYAV